MRRPGLNQHHITRNQARRIGTGPRIRLAVKHHRPLSIGWVPKDLVEMNGESVQVADVQWTEVRVECVVEECVVDGKVHGEFVFCDSYGTL